MTSHDKTGALCSVYSVPISKTYSRDSPCRKLSAADKQQLLNFLVILNLI